MKHIVALFFHRRT